jgi:glycosyltransferase involved in cell wall biosynthesis
MRVVFVTTLSLSGSTVRGRAIPLAQQLSAQHETHLLTLSSTNPHENINTCPPRLHCHFTGQEPFTRNQSGKTRLSGFSLVFNMITTAWKIFRKLSQINPDCVIIVKAMPHNTFGILLWHWFKRLHQPIILDVDDFELSANQLSSFIQRAAVHWSERVAANLSDAIVTATPFLNDHFQFLKPRKNNIHTIPTGVDPLPNISSSPNNQTTIAYLGSLSRSSGHKIDMLPTILNELISVDHNIKLLIAGSGDDESFLRQELNKLHLDNHIIWYGKFTTVNLPQILSQTTILIDPISNTITERAKSSFRATIATVASKPIVTSNIGIRADLIPSNLHSRFFANPGDSTDYAQKILNLIKSPLSTTEQSALKIHGQKFTWPVLAQRYQDVIKQVSS